MCDLPYWDSLRDNPGDDQKRLQTILDEYDVSTPGDTTDSSYKE